MALKTFTFKNLEELDGGRVVVAFDTLVKRIAADCEDRAGLKTARTVTLQLALVPIANDDGTLNCVKAQFALKESIPSRSTKLYDLHLRKSRSGDMLIFNDLSDDDASQRTIDEEIERNGRDGKSAAVGD